MELQLFWFNMGKTKSEFSYEELLQKVKEQELLIKQLNDEKLKISDIEYFVKDSLDLLCIADYDAHFKMVNDAFTTVLGYSKDELLSKPFLEFIHPDDVESTLSTFNLLAKNLPIIDFENRYISKDGEIVFLQWKANLNTANNLIYSIARDVTAFRKTQEKLLASEKSLNEAQKIAKIGSWDFSLLTQELNWSNELYEIFEFERIPNDTELYGKYLSYFLPQDAEILRMNINKTIADRLPYEMEHQIVLPNKVIKWVFCTGVAIMDNNDNVIALKGVVQDITQKNRLMIP